MWTRSEMRTFLHQHAGLNVDRIGPHWTPLDPIILVIFGYVLAFSGINSIISLFGYVII